MTKAVASVAMPGTGPWNCAALFSGILPPAIKTMNFLGQTLNRLGVGPRRLDADTLLAAACRRAGLDDPGPFFDEARLVRLLSALNGEARLNAIGRFMAYSDLLHLLETRLYLAGQRRRYPAIDRQVIMAPVFVTGLPRTGSTLLHRLLARDPAHRAPAAWEIMHPPSPGEGPEQIQSRIRLAQSQLCWFRHITCMDSIHGLDAGEPEECIAITAHALSGPRFHVTYWAPEYERWLRRVDQRPLYAYHRYFLQHLQACSSSWRRWLLKAPAHMDSLPALIDTYPDAVIIQTHRDPVTVLASVASLTDTLQSAFREPVPQEQIGEQVIERWSHAVNRSLQQREQLREKGVRFIDVYYEELVREPLATVRRVYREAGLTLGVAAEQRMQAFLRLNPKDRHGVHAYDPANFRIDPVHVSAAFKSYYDYFDLGTAAGRSHAA